MTSVVTTDLVDINKVTVSAAIAALAPTTGDFVGSVVLGQSVMFWKRTP